MRTQLLAHLTLDGCRWRGPLPAGHQFRLNLIGHFDGQQELQRLEFEGNCTCRKRLTYAMTAPYCWAFTSGEQRTAEEFLESVLAELHDRHFGVAGPPHPALVPV